VSQTSGASEALEASALGGRALHASPSFSSVAAAIGSASGAGRSIRSANPVASRRNGGWSGWAGLADGVAPAAVLWALLSESECLLDELVRVVVERLPPEIPSLPHGPACCRRFQSLPQLSSPVWRERRMILKGCERS
jgi:hypothetical protein